MLERPSKVLFSGERFEDRVGGSFCLLDDVRRDGALEAEGDEVRASGAFPMWQVAFANGDFGAAHECESSAIGKWVESGDCLGTGTEAGSTASTEAGATKSEPDWRTTVLHSAEARSSYA